jgi:hypothetical protein
VLDDRVGETLVVVLDDGSGVADVVFEALVVFQAEGLVAVGPARRRRGIYRLADGRKLVSC